MPPIAALAAGPIIGGLLGSAGAIGSIGALGGAALGLGVGGAIASSLEKADALEAAGDIAGADQIRQEAVEQQKLELAQQELAIGRPTREAIGQAGPGLVGQLTQAGDISQAGTGPSFQANLERGSAALMRSLAPFGLADSSTAGRGIGELTSGLLGQDINRRTAITQGLLGLTPSTATGANLFGQTGGPLGSGLQASIAAQSPSAGLFGDLAQTGTTIGSIPLLQSFGLFGGSGSRGGTTLPQITSPQTLNLNPRF